MTRELSDAQHEAAHVVVGVALGLRLRRAALGTPDTRGRYRELGFVLFDVPPSKRIAWAITVAAGIAFARRVGSAEIESARVDQELLRDEGHNAHAIAALVVAADAILETRGTAHARVTRALLQQDITAAHVEAIAKGERVDAE